jgi:hypothetical protein
MATPAKAAIPALGSLLAPFVVEAPVAVEVFDVVLELDEDATVDLAAVVAAGVVEAAVPPMGAVD